MGCLRTLFCLICPPLAVVDRGCASFIIVTVLWVAGWVPGVLAALFVNLVMADED